MTVANLPKLNNIWILSNRKSFVYHNTNPGGKSYDVSWLHCSHQEQEGVFLFFFYIHQYRQSLLTSVEHETISTKSVLFAFLVFVHTVFTAIKRPLSTNRASLCTSRSHCRPLYLTHSRPIPFSLPPPPM